MPDLESHWLAERLAFLSHFLRRDTVWEHKVKVAFPRLKSIPKTKSCHRPRSETPFLSALHSLPGSSDLSQFQKELYRELVVGFALDLLKEQLS